MQIIHQKNYASGKFEYSYYLAETILRHSAYKWKARSNSSTHGNKQQSILYLRENDWPNIETKNVVETSNLWDYYFYSNAKAR